MLRGALTRSRPCVPAEGAAGSAARSHLLPPPRLHPSLSDPGTPSRTSPRVLQCEAPGSAPSPAGGLGRSRRRFNLSPERRGSAASSTEA